MLLYYGTSVVGVKKLHLYCISLVDFISKTFHVYLVCASFSADLYNNEQIHHFTGAAISSSVIFHSVTDYLTIHFYTLTNKIQ